MAIQILFNFLDRLYEYSLSSKIYFRINFRKISKSIARSDDAVQYPVIGRVEPVVPKMLLNELNLAGIGFDGDEAYVFNTLIPDCHPAADKPRSR